MKTLSKLARTVVATVGLSAAIGATTANAQGFFQSLFGGGPSYEGRSTYSRDTDRQSNFFGWGQQRPYDNGTLDPNDPRLHREMNRRRATSKPTGEGAAPVAKQAAVEPTIDAPRGSVAYFAKDKTLRPGDVVVTEKGFLIYQGGDHASTKAFVALDKGGTKSDRAGLIALEKVSTMRTENVQFEGVTAMRDFVGPRTKEQMDAHAELRELSTASR